MGSMLRFFFSTYFLAAGLVLTAVPSVTAEQINVFAAASLQEALSDVISQFEAASGHDVTVSFAGSSALARQVEYGAPADVIMLANVNWMSHLESQKLIQSGSKKSFLGNQLAVIVPEINARRRASGNGTELSQILKSGRVAMALVEAVPAGIYGKEALMSLELWDVVRTNVVETDNVRAALALVALGEVAAGIVYASDALVEDRVRIVGLLPTESHSEIVYPVAVAAGRGRPEVIEFMAYLDSEAAREAFANRGFSVSEGTQ